MTLVCFLFCLRSIFRDDIELWSNIGDYMLLILKNNCNNIVVVVSAIGIIRIILRPTRGFNPDVINDLAKKTAEFEAEERFVSILFDEMKIQEELSLGQVYWRTNLGLLTWVTSRPMLLP